MALGGSLPTTVISLGVGKNKKDGWVGGLLPTWRGPRAGGCNVHRRPGGLPTTSAGLAH